MSYPFQLPEPQEFPQLMLDFEFTYRSVTRDELVTVPVNFNQDIPLGPQLNELVEDVLDDRPIVLHHATKGTELAERHVMRDIRTTRIWPIFISACSHVAECRALAHNQVVNSPVSAYYLEGPIAIYKWRRYQLEGIIYNLCRKACYLERVKLQQFPGDVR